MRPGEHDAGGGIIDDLDLHADLRELHVDLCLIGTTRMADDPHDGVVDRDCRVHGIDNLYLARNSVFPTGGHVNPTFSIVALALCLSDHLQYRLLEA